MRTPAGYPPRPRPATLRTPGLIFLRSGRNGFRSRPVTETKRQTLHSEEEDVSRCHAAEWAFRASNKFMSAPVWAANRSGTGDSAGRIESRTALF